MNLQTIFLLAGILSFCTSAPVFQQQLGIIASNSNEIVGLPGLTLAGIGMGQAQVQGTPFLSPFLIQQPTDLLLPQLIHFGPQFPFLSSQPNQPGLLFPALPQEQPTGSVNPVNTLPNQDPAQVMPPFYPYPQAPGGQGFPYYLNYGFPQRNTMLRPQLIQKPTVQNPVVPTRSPHLVHECDSYHALRSLKTPRMCSPNNGNVPDPWRMTSPPDNRGDLPGRGVDGDPVVPFFEP